MGGAAARCECRTSVVPVSTPPCPVSWLGGWIRVRARVRVRIRGRVP